MAQGTVDASSDDWSGHGSPDTQLDGGDCVWNGPDSFHDVAGSGDAGRPRTVRTGWLCPGGSALDGGSASLRRTGADKGTVPGLDQFVTCAPKGGADSPRAGDPADGAYAVREHGQPGTDGDDSWPAWNDLAPVRQGGARDGTSHESTGARA